MPSVKDYSAFFEASPNALVILSSDLVVLAVNRAFRQMVGRSQAEVIGRNLFEAFPENAGHPHGTQAEALKASFQRVLQTGLPDKLHRIAYPIARPGLDGPLLEQRYWSITNVPIPGASGTVESIMQSVVDITEFESYKASQSADASKYFLNQLSPIEGNVFVQAQMVQKSNFRLDQERRHLKRLFEQAPGFIAFLREPNHIFELVNAAYYQLVGHRPLIGKPVREALPEVEGQGFFELLDKVFSTGEPFVGRSLSVLIQREPGAPLVTRYVDFVYQPIMGPDGKVTGVFCQGNDVTEQKMAQDQLDRHRDNLEKLVVERTRALEQSQALLQHSQKLEAIGKLTGGVAHDFNNVLQIIAGNLHLLQEAVPANTKARIRLDAAEAAVERGAKLSSQLLAFARRQALQPVVTNLRKIVRGMDDLLRRALGAAIQIETVVAGGLWNTCVDTGQLENVILNLAINARDAMKTGGKLTIELGNTMLDDHYAMSQPDVAAGQYVLLAISDTGTGMDKEVLERAFDPFFTTKPEGEGTGLGLSMAHGFVKQSGGHIRIYSETGHGTTVKIYLPRSVQPEVEHAPMLDTAVSGGTETILVVEDDLAVRATVADMLTDLGYRVLQATNGEKALAVLQSGVPVDMIFTDVVMPGPLRSVELARQAKIILPDVEILFTSGYTQNAIVHGGRLDEGVALLSKPYRREDLARKVRHMLENKKQLSATGGAERASVSSPAHPLKILVVEDNADFRELLCEMLVMLGHSVVSEASAEDALDAIRQNDVDLIISDLTLPGISGIELVKKVHAAQPHVKIILSSGYDVSTGSQLDFNVGILSKPYSLKQLAQALEELDL